MEIYLICMLLSVMLACILTSGKFSYKGKQLKKVSLIYVLIAMLPLLILAILRWNVGVDVVYGSGYYYKEYIAIQNGFGNVMDYEVGFYLLMKLCSFLHLNLYAFYVLVTLIFFSLVANYLVKNCVNIGFCILIFVLSDFYLFSFSTLRQSLGIAFLLFPISMILKGEKYWRNWKWWLSIVVAITMHVSILYLLLSLIVAQLKIKKKVLLVLVIIGCGLGPVLQYVFGNLVKYTVYEAKYFGTNEYQMEFTPTYFIVALVFFLLVFKNYNKLAEDDKNIQIINMAGIVAVIMSNSSLLIMPYRIFALFIPIYLVIYTKLINCHCHSKVERTTISIILMFLFVALFINQYYIQGASELYRYKSIFENLSQVFSQ